MSQHSPDATSSPPRLAAWREQRCGAVAWVDGKGAPALAFVTDLHEPRPVVEAVPVSSRPNARDGFCGLVPNGSEPQSWAVPRFDEPMSPAAIVNVLLQGPMVGQDLDDVGLAIDEMWPATTDEATALDGTTSGTVAAVPLPDGRLYFPRLVGDHVDVDLVRGMRGELFTRLKGRSGNGKTMLAEAAFGDDLIVVEGHGALEVDDLVGKFLPREAGAGYEWHDGPLTRAMREGKVLLIDELTRAPSDTINVLMAPADDRRMLIIDGRPDDPVVHAAPGFHIIVTYNEFGVGVRPLDDAIVRRLPMELEVTTDYDLVAALGVDPRLVSVGRRLAEADRHAQDRGEVGVWAPQTGHLLKADRPRKLGFGDQICAGVLLAACTEPHDVELVSQILSEELGVQSPQLRQGATA